MDADAGEDPDLLLRRMGRSEVIVAATTVGLLTGGLVSHGAVRWGLLIGCCLTGGLLIWSLGTLLMAYVGIHTARRMGFIPPRRDR